MKRNSFLLILSVLFMAISQPVFAGESKLIGLWTITVHSTNSSGEPCPFVPEAMQFFKDQTLIMSHSGDQHMPYKTTLTKDERQALEKRNPDFKGKNLLLVKPNPNMEWSATPMVYIYSINKKELTLTLQGWSPAKFSRSSK